MKTTRPALSLGAIAVVVVDLEGSSGRVSASCKSQHARIKNARARAITLLVREASERTSDMDNGLSNGTAVCCV